MLKLKLTSVLLLYAGFIVPSSFAQDATASGFAKQVKSDISALSSQRSVGAWREDHPDEKLELAHYDYGQDQYETDLGDDFFSWCAASISQSSASFGRVALFFVPSVNEGASSLLPDPRAASVKESCYMRALHYKISPDFSVQDVVREFSSVWGTPNRSRAVSGREYGLPENIYGDIAIWNHDGFNARLRYLYTLQGAGEQRTGLTLYLKSDALPATPCVECRESLMHPLPKDKLKRAEKMDRGGNINELTALWTLSDSCPHAANNHLWPDVAIEHAESFLTHFPSDQWTPYAHWALAMAHSAKLQWTYPGGSIYENDGEILALSPAAKEQERTAAIEQFKAFIDARPEGREAAFASAQIWRLLAGLPPTSFSWGCTGE